MATTITLILGDGIGREVSEAAQKVIEAVGVDINWEIQEAGADIMNRYNKALPRETVESIVKNKIALKGPTATPIGSGFKSVNVGLRKTLDLYANFRPAKTVNGIPSRYKDVDLIVVRENTEGLYSGLEHLVIPGVVESLRNITEAGSDRIVRFAFETDQKH